MVSELSMEDLLPTNQRDKNPKVKSADILTPLMGASIHHPAADTNTSAPNANNMDMTAKTVTQEMERHCRSLHHRYLHYNIWREDSFSLVTADWTEHAIPLPRPPVDELNNPVTAQTIADHPSLFKIVTFISVNQFHKLLSNHPNQPFVWSVCEGLQNGFWPWADIIKDSYPDTHNASQPIMQNDCEVQFLQDQIHTEITKNCFSPTFGTDLLPGMYCMPIYAVPKTIWSPNLWMVTDQSAGAFSLNSWMEWDSGILTVVQHTTHRFH